MTQNPNNDARVLPFRVIAFRVPARKFEEIENHIRFAAHIIGLDAPLDWEDRNTACRQLARRALRARGNQKSEQFPALKSRARRETKSRRAHATFYLIHGFNFYLLLTKP